MTGSGLLPVAWHKNKLFFLFGKENSMEDSAKGYSDFGGGVEDETIFDTALREGAEELTGFLGDENELRKKIDGVFPLVWNDYHTHIVRMKYDDQLVKYYNANHAFLWKRMNKTMLNESKLFEKIEIGWFSIAQMKKRRSEFRAFYRNMIDLIINHQKKIETFVKKRQTRKKIRKNNI